MELSDYKMHAPNMVCIGVDRMNSGDCRGRIWHQYSADPVLFKTTVGLMKELDGLYDRWNFPQRSTNARSFDDPGHRNPAATRERERKDMDERRLAGKTGEIGTFLVRVKYRQNATWQGEIVWVEGNQRQYFRSALELLKLIDSALKKESENQGKPEDKKQGKRPSVI